MPDDNFRAFRSREPLPRDDDQLAGEASDPLAELARLIGQTDPYVEAQRAGGHSEPQLEDHPEPSEDWAAEEEQGYEEGHADDRYAPPPLTPSTDSYPPFARQDRGYEDEAAPRSDRYFSGPATQFTGFREEPDTRYQNEHAQAVRARELPTYSTAEPEEDYGASEAEHAHGESYATDDYYSESVGRPRRRGVVAVMAVLGLVVLGTAGAFGYRAMFGGSVIPSLPPIIKPSGAPNKIMPSTADSQPRNGGETSLASAGSTDSLVSREEQPLNVEPAKQPPRVVASIPVPPAQNGPPPGLIVGAAPGPAPAANAAAPSPWPPAPPPMPNTTPAPTPTPGPAQVTAEPKRIHTVTIRPDQGANSDAAPAPPVAPAPAPAAAHAAARPAPGPKPKPSEAASTPQPAANAPLSIVPGRQPEAPVASSVRTRASAPPIAIASAAPAAVVPAPSGGGRYSVQVTSQRSESEAQASFRELQAKFPNQLRGREPIIRRADLGSKGTYYRALVGPFASAEEAASMCSGLKAAGGNCLVQKN
jgi:hypothetical protein